MFDKKKQIPKREEPDDSVNTVYCDSTAADGFNDMLPYVSPLPKTRRSPEPPII